MEDKKQGVLNKVGPYFIDKALGEGSFGIVKTARHETTNEMFAVKIISKEKMNIPAYSKNVLSEIRHLKMFIRHPHIIKLYEVLFTPTNIFMVMEYAQGGTLKQYLIRCGYRLLKKQARRFFQQIISAVDYFHSHNIIHRDLKPANMLLDVEYNIKIADFGLSAELEDGKFINTHYGTKYFKAPEVINKMDYIGPECDIWSCGVVLYLMLFNLQSERLSLDTFLYDTGERVFQTPEYADENLQNLLNGMLEKEGRSRATIKAIRDNPWFSKKLDPQLFPPPAQQAAFVALPEIVQKICKIHKTSEVNVRRALLEGDSDNDFYKTYNMLQEGQWKEAHVRDILDPFIEHTTNKSQRKTEKWGVGIKVALAIGEEIMEEIFTVLKHLDFEWSPIDYWQIVVRKRYRNTARYNVMSIQLYQVNVKHLLDFRSLGFQFPSEASSPECQFVMDEYGDCYLVHIDPCVPSHSPDGSSAVCSNGTTVDRSSDSISIASSVETHSPEDLRRHEVMEFFEMCSIIFENLRLNIIPRTYGVEKYNVC